MHLSQKDSVIHFVHFDALVLLCHLKVDDFSQIKFSLHLHIFVFERLVKISGHDDDLEVEMRCELVVYRHEFTKDALVSE